MIHKICIHYSATRIHVWMIIGVLWLYFPGTGNSSLCTGVVPKPMPDPGIRQGVCFYACPKTLVELKWLSEIWFFSTLWTVSTANCVFHYVRPCDSPHTLNNKCVGRVTVVVIDFTSKIYFISLLYDRHSCSLRAVEGELITIVTKRIAVIKRAGGQNTTEAGT
jgi:hypothetical protein